MQGRLYKFTPSLPLQHHIYSFDNMAALRNCCNLPKNASSLLMQSKTGTIQITSNCNRSFSSSSSIQGRGITEKGKRKVQAKHDAKLRHAIDLYHTSHHFYPTKPTITGQANIGILSSEELQQNFIEEEKELILRSFDDEIDWIIRANLFLRKKENFDLHAPSNMYTEPKPPIEMRSASALFDHLERQRTNSEILEQTLLLDTVGNNFLFGTKQDAATINPEDYPLPDPNDTDAMKSYIADAVREVSLASRSTEGNAPHHTKTFKDLRSLRIRDALFGTVQGSLPGLEIVRERSRDPRVQEEAKRLIKEAKEARGRQLLREKRALQSDESTSTPSV